MSKILAIVASGLVVVGTFGFIATRAMADSNPTSATTSVPYQAMTQYMNSPEGQQMYGECNSYMQQWGQGQTGK